MAVNGSGSIVTFSSGYPSYTKKYQNDIQLVGERNVPLKRSYSSASGSEDGHLFPPSLSSRLFQFFSLAWLTWGLQDKSQGVHLKRSDMKYLLDEELQVGEVFCLQNHLHEEETLRNRSVQGAGAILQNYLLLRVGPSLLFFKCPSHSIDPLEPNNRETFNWKERENSVSSINLGPWSRTVIPCGRVVHFFSFAPEIPGVEYKIRSRQKGEGSVKRPNSNIHTVWTVAQEASRSETTKHSVRTQKHRKSSWNNVRKYHWNNGGTEQKTQEHFWWKPHSHQVWHPLWNKNWLMT
jgi:hypothetical protein